MFRFLSKAAIAALALPFTLASGQTTSTPNLPMQQMLWLSSASYNTASHGIAGVINQCVANAVGSTQGGICPAAIPFNYPVDGELLPGFSLGGAPSATYRMTNGMSLCDMRLGNYCTIYNAPGTGLSNIFTASNNHWFTHWNAIYNDPPWIVKADNIGGMYLEADYLHGFRNFNQNGQGDKTDQVNVNFQLLKWGQGQGINLQYGSTCYANGDCISHSTGAQGYGGISDATGEGTHLGDNTGFEGIVEDTGTIASSNAGSGPTSITVSETQGPQTAGEGRLIALGNATWTGTISSLANNSSSPTVIDTTSAPGFAASTFVAVGVSAVTVSGGGSAIVSCGYMVYCFAPPAGGTQTFTITPNTPITGTVSSLTTSSLVCFGDGGNFEMAHPTAVTSSTFTVVLNRGFTTGVTMASGGACGYGVNIDADNVTQSTGTGIPGYLDLLNKQAVSTVQIIGVLHQKFYPILYSPSTTELMVHH